MSAKRDLGSGKSRVHDLVRNVPEGVAVVGEGGGGAGVPLLRTRAQRGGEVQAEIYCVAHLNIDFS